MTLRLAYSDEFARAKKRLEGYLVPPHAQFLVVVKELPVERIIATIPYWIVGVEEQEKRLHFHPSVNDEGIFDQVLMKLEEEAQVQEVSVLHCDFPLGEEHSLYTTLTSSGFTIVQTDRYFQVSGDMFKTKAFRLYQKLQAKIPRSWEVKSIRGQDPETLFKFVAPHGLISPQAFQNYWNSANREHFEEQYSKVLIDGETIIGAILLTHKGEQELHIHVEACAPEYQEQLGLITTTLRNASCSACVESFPDVYTFRAESKKHQHFVNTVLRQGGRELPPKYFLTKEL